jgi:hypothetical protein
VRSVPSECAGRRYRRCRVRSAGTNWCTEPLRRKGSGLPRITKSGGARTVTTGETDQESAPPSDGGF